MFLGILPQLVPQQRYNKNKFVNLSFGYNPSSKISPKVEDLFVKACAKIETLRLEIDPVEKAYSELHPEMALSQLKAEDMYHRPVSFVVKDKEKKSFKVSHYPVIVDVENGIAQISGVKAGESVDYNDPNKYIEWAFEAICAS